MARVFSCNVNARKSLSFYYDLHSLCTVVSLPTAIKQLRFSLQTFDETDNSKIRGLAIAYYQNNALNNCIFHRNLCIGHDMLRIYGHNLEPGKD